MRQNRDFCVFLRVFAYFHVFQKFLRKFCTFLQMFARFRAICATTCKTCLKTCNIYAKTFKTCAKTCKIREHTQKCTNIRENHGSWPTYLLDFRANSKTYQFSYYPPLCSSDGGRGRGARAPDKCINSSTCIHAYMHT